MKKILLLALLPFQLFAQNLVPNWSFETHTNCPTDFNQITLSTGWKKCQENNDGIHHTDYMNVCGGNNGAAYFTVPSNVWGYQNASNGEAYVALSTTALNLFPGYRENIYCQLLQPTIVGASYTVSMKVNKSNKTQNATNRIGIKFSTDSTFAINNSSQLHAYSIISDTSQWTLLTATFIADSAYQYLAVGNFYTDDSTSIVNVCNTCPQVPSEYLIDDICVHKGNESDCVHNVGLPNIADHTFTVNCFQSSGSIDVIFNTAQNGTYAFKVCNTLGQQLTTVQRFCNAGNSTFSLPVKIQCDAVLVLQVSDRNSVFSQKVFINGK